MQEQFVIGNIHDVAEIENVPLKDRLGPKNTYDLIARGAEIDRDAVAISFIKDGNSFQSPQQITYGQFMGKIRQTANMLNDMGVGPKDVVTYLLPNTAGGIDPATGIDVLDALAALDRLEPEDRALIAMRYVVGFDATELAAATGTSPAATRQRLKRLLDRLRQELE